MEVLTKTRTKLTYLLNQSGYTVLHRAALGGLAATIMAWKEQPDGLSCIVENDKVEINWDQNISGAEAVERLLKASFKLTSSGLIDLPGQGIKNREDLRVAVHNALAQTFLQHPKSRPGEKEARKFVLSFDEQEHIFSYKPILRYAHQTAQGTGLLKRADLPDVATISQAIVPGAFTGAHPLDASSDQVILLLYLMVGCAVFHLRPQAQDTKAQYCVVIPDVIDLKRFATAVHRIVEYGGSSKFKSNSLLGRVAGGTEEAALRFLLDLKSAAATDEASVNGCQAIAMGKVAWDPNQVNRSMTVRVGTDYPELDVFEAAENNLGRARLIKTKKGDSFVVPSSHVPDLVAANIAKGNHWCQKFSSLMSNQDDAEKMFRSKEGLVAMKAAIKNEGELAVDLAVINAFHDAWRRTLGGLGERGDREKLGEAGTYRLMDREREKIRNSILRAKTSDMLAGWFLRFCANATEGKSLKAIKDDSERIRHFIFENRNFDRFQNLCLFALVSYESPQKAQPGAADS